MENNSEIEVLQANSLSHNVEENSEDENLCDKVVISIEDMLKQLPPTNEKSSIYRVSKQLREMNLKAYAPQVISIGPFHHQCPIGGNFTATEQYKLQGLINFLRHIDNDEMKYSLKEEVVKNRSLEDLLKTGSLKDLVKKAHCWMKEARNCYTEPIGMDDHTFLKIMLVDACFIVEFFIREYDRNFFDQIEDDVDLSLLYQEIRLDIFHDLMKLENQVPFFLLQHLYDLLLLRDGNPTSLTDLIESFAQKNWSLANQYKNPLRYCNIKPKHLVDFLSFYFRPLPKHLNDKQNKWHEKNMNKFLSFLCVLFPAYRQKQHEENSCEKKNNNNHTFLSFFHVLLCCLWQKPGEIINEEELFPPSITELCEAGVIIKKAKDVKYLMDINFKNGVLEIPPIHIYDDFELLLRNIMAFEQFQRNKYALHYVSFLDYLISTEKDVCLLVKARVIINNIGGSDKEISYIFNNICKFVTLSTYSSYRLEDISKALREHCNGRWNKAKASLKHNYFNTPWAVISFIAATFLILLTLLQTIFSAISAFP